MLTRLLPRPVLGAYIAVVLVAALSVWLVHNADRRDTARVKREAAARAVGNCEAINKGYAATRLVKRETAAVQVAQVEALKLRFAQSNQQNPPSSAGAHRSATGGEAFFEGLVDDTKRLTAEGIARVDAATMPLNCH